MFDVFCLGLALTVGQGSPTTVSPLPPAPRQSSFATEQTPRPATHLTPVAAPAAPTLLPPITAPVLPQPAPARLRLFPVAQPIPAPPVLGPAPMAPMAPMPPMPPMSNAPMTLTPMPLPAPKDLTAPAPKAGPKSNDGGDKKSSGGNKKSSSGDSKGDDDKDDKKGDEEKEEEKEETPFFMKMLEGTYHGAVLESKGINVNGWMAFSYNASTRNVTNLPYVWNDRADQALLQQFWVNIEKTIDTEKSEVQHGGKVALLYGSDYRYTLIRGFFNNQLKNVNADPRELNGFEQNIYGGDIPLAYYSLFLPGVGGEWTQVDVGRMFCPWGVESVMAPSTPFMSRSYAFNWAPPFFHVGVMATTKVSKYLTVKNMVVNGNDVFFDGSQEWRYVGIASFTSPDENTTLSVATSFGEGRFNPDRPNGPAQGITTIGLAYEPAGRNNFNCFDVTVTHKVDDKLSFAVEGIYGYQTNVPAGATGNANNFNGGSGTASWASAVGYAFYNFDQYWTGQARFEAFYDAEGQRTGFEGLYYSATLGLICKPCDAVLIRPEIRYDCNNYSRPFTGRHDILVAGADVILKF